ncbi:N-acetylmuramoyl-L-alanine amidase [Neobacillus cucumis]|uniref:N-acetylmuramoyl-L-alanine amidase n=1 Tax=Neobacillus cucumis TaxID=1740721 RepID=UPI0018DF77CD|nr:N-acetylmuramoyl-L-alanine amidase [Neobacillus cucumis]MBI0578029.1 N-acetylmuramoyl-L-alanine amidase [Neobacillus cucumis]
MITTKLKNFGLVKLLIGLSVIAIPFVEMDQDAYANPSPTKVTVTATNLNVRESPGISGKVLGLVHKGDTFVVIRKKNNWDQIKLGNNQIGWISHAYTAPPKNVGATVNADFLNVRTGPGVSNPVIGKLDWGAQIAVQAEQAGWAKIVSSSGMKGWVNEYYITKHEPDKLHTQAVSKPPTSKTTMDHDKKSPAPAPATKSSKTPAAKTTIQGPLNGKTIVLDPGHGGVDIGTTSIDGTHEKKLTLETAKAVEQKLKNAGANVIMTRTNDTYISLPERSTISNQNNADAFISFHYNWIKDPSVHGVTDFYFQKSRDNELASNILDEVAKTTKLENVGTRFNNLSVLRNNAQPSTLIELGFLSNKQDDSIVEGSAFNENVAQGIYLGLLDYFSKNNKELKKTP